MKYAANLTELLNSNPEAYEFFYALPPDTQTKLQGRDIRSMDELHEAALDEAMDNRPQAF